MTTTAIRLGRYHLLEPVGSGGMSVVYRAIDTELEREVAVKVLHPHLSGKEESRRRLIREAKAVAKLKHRNILEIYEYSAKGPDETYLVTEFIRGRTLRQFLEAHHTSPPEVAAMVIHEVASALAHAHQQGVIHRDLKPENVMVRDDGVLKLMDFGIAKIIDRNDKMTITGTLIGSPAHMAPEIIEGEEADERSDVFSLGTMLYLLCTGQLPFNAANTTATLRKILEASYDDPRRLAPELSDELAAIIGSCLKREPGDRYGDAGELKEALFGYLSSLKLDRCAEELSVFFVDPEGYQSSLLTSLADQRTSQADSLLRSGQTGKALACLNLVLAHRPSDPAALGLLRRIEAGKKRRRILLRIAAAFAAAIGIGSLTAAALAWSKRGLHPSPIAQAPPVTPTATAPALPTPVPPAIRRPGPDQADPSSRTAKASPAPSVRRPLPQVPVVIQVRPFGYIQLDQGPKSPQALMQHQIPSLPVGRHTVRVSCEFCQEIVESIDVREGAPNLFRLAAQLKPSQVRFDVQPADASIRIGGQIRAAKDSLIHPFEVQSPRGQPIGRHRIDYEVFSKGYRPLHKVAEVEPGKTVTLAEVLRPQ